MQPNSAPSWGLILTGVCLLAISGVIDLTPVLTTLAEIGEAFNAHFRK